MTPDIIATMARQRRESIRWYLLLACNVARPAGASVTMLLAVIQANYADATELEVQRELDYLDDRKLVAIERRPTGQWHCELTRHGVDFVEYTVDAQPGIARPLHPL